MNASKPGHHFMFNHKRIHKQTQKQIRLKTDHAGGSTLVKTCILDLDVICSQMETHKMVFLDFWSPTIGGAAETYYL